MEGERRKRKLENEEENEEQKMETFFSLIKKTKDVRDGLYKDKADMKIDGERARRSIWNPTFQPEDFIDSGQMGKTEKELIEKKQDLQEDQEKDKASEPLDLNLSL